MNQSTTNRILLLILLISSNVLSSTVLAQQFKKQIGGIGTSLGFAAGSKKIQLIYTAADLGITTTTGVVDKIYFRKSSASPTSATLSNLQIKLGYTLTSVFGSSGTTFYSNLTPVLFSASQVVTGPNLNTFFSIDVFQQFTLPAGASLIVEFSNTNSTTSSFSILASTGLSTPNNKVLTSTNVNATTGSPSTTWPDFGIDFTTLFTTPANNECATAIPKTMGSFCSPFSGNTVGASQSLSPVTCQGATATTAKDIWYSFVPNAPGDSIAVVGLGGFDPVIQVLTGTCSGLVSVACADDPGSGTATEIIAPGTFIPGQTYYLRVYGWGGVDGSFSACLKSDFVAAPANDDCAGSTLLTATATCNGTVGNTTGASQDLQPLACGTATSTFANDVWYTFTATSSGDSVVVDPFDLFDPVLEIFSGPCTALTQLSCSDDPNNGLATEKVAPGTLVIGQTYTVRVYGFNGSEGNFSICVKSKAPVTSINDICLNALSLNSSATCNSTLGNNTGATQSLAPATCLGGTSSSALDVWYKFVANGSGDSVIVSRSGVFDPVLEVFSGNCAALTSLGCSDQLSSSAIEKLAPGTLIPGQTYFIRVYGFGGGIGNFNICVKRVGSVVTTFDECAGALNLTVGTTCNTLAGTTTGATPSNVVSCTGFPDDDVWYKFTASTTGNYVFRLSTIEGFDGAMQIFSGNCGALTSLACIDRTVAGAQEDTILNLLTAGGTYYIRVYNSDPGSGTGAFGICVNRVVAPSNDNCSGALILAVSSVGVCNQVNTTSYGATQSLAPINCTNSTSTTANDVWVRVVPTSTSLKLFVDNVGASDPVIEAFLGSCSALVSIGCKDDSIPGFGETLYLTGLTAGTPVFFRIYSYAPQIYGDFTVCASQVGCVSQSGVASLSVPSLVSNGRIIFSLVNSSPGASIQWQVSSDNANWTNAGVPTTALTDTFYVNSATTVTYFVRAEVTATGCVPATSNVNQFTIQCATPLNNRSPSSTGHHITNFSLGSINNTSTPNPADGAYQNFKSQTANLCIGKSYTLTVTPSLSGTSFTKAAWIDYNGDGDFADVGENIVAPVAGTGLFTRTFLVSPNANPGVVTMRIMLYTPGTSMASSDPCFVGPYATGEIEEYSVNLSQSPTVANAGNNFTSCSSSGTLLGNTPTSGSGLWTVISGGGSIFDAFSPTASVSNLSLGANVFQWSVSTSCSTTVSQVTVTYSGAAVTANAGADQNLCNESSDLSGNAAGTGGTGQWTRIIGNGILTNPNSPASGVSGLSAGINRFVWTINTPGCSSSKDTVTLFRYLSPTPAFVGNDQQVCGSSATLSGNAVTVGTGLWTLVSGTGQISNPTQNNSQVTGLGSGNNVFRWTSSNGTCASTSDDLSIVVTPSVIAQAGNNQTLCSDQTSLTGNNPSPSTGSWSLLTGTGTIINGNSANASVSGLGAGLNSFVWTINNGNCPSTKDTVSITRVISQGATAGQDQSVCGGQGTLQANTVVSGTGLWSLVSGSGQIENSSNPNSLVSGLGTGQNVFRWTVSNPPCTQATDEVTIANLGNATIAQAGQDQNICNTQASLAGNTAVFGIGQWTLISGAGTIAAPSSPTSSVTGLGVGLNVFRWSITNGNCPTSFDDVLITRIASPSIASAGTDQNICTNSATLSSNQASVGIGLWSLVSGSGQIQNPSSAQTQVTGLGTGANTFRWTISNAPCTNSSDDVIINSTTNAVTATAGQDQVLCTESAVLAGNSAGNGTGIWSVVSGSGTFTSPNSPGTSATNLGTGDNVFRWTITNGTCPPSSDDVTVTRTNTVSLAIAGVDQNLCTSSSVLSANSPQTGTGMWTVVSGTGTITNPSSPNTTVTGLGNGANVFRWTISNIPCPPSTDDVTVTTTLSAITSNAGTDQSVCGGSAQLIGNSQGTGIGLWTVVSGSGNITNPGGSQTSVTGLGIGQNVFRWTITSGTCTPSLDEVSITSVSNPVASNAGADQNICGSSASLTGNGASQGVGTWTLVSGSGQVANPTSPTTTVVGLGNGANVFRWTISNSPCTPSFDEVSINATPANVTAQAGIDRIICGSSTFLNGTAPIAGFGVWTLVSGAGTISQPGNPVSEITNLGSGVNTFAWTVTSGSCTASDLVVITKEIKTLDLGSDSLACIGTPVVLNAGAGYASYSWFDNSGSQTITVGSSGQYWVQVMSANGCSYRDTVKVTFVVCTDVGPILLKADVLEIYPNPGDGQIHIRLESELVRNSKLRVYNSTGILILDQEMISEYGKATKDLDLRSSPSGLYIVEIQNEKGRQIRKLIIR